MGIFSKKGMDENKIKGRIEAVANLLSSSVKVGTFSSKSLKTQATTLL